MARAIRAASEVDSPERYDDWADAAAYVLEYGHPLDAQLFLQSLIGYVHAAPVPTFVPIPTMNTGHSPADIHPAEPEPPFGVVGWDDVDTDAYAEPEEPAAAPRARLVPVVEPEAPKAARRPRKAPAKKAAPTRRPRGRVDITEEEGPPPELHGAKVALNQPLKRTPPKKASGHQLPPHLQVRRGGDGRIDITPEDQ